MSPRPQGSDLCLVSVSGLFLVVSPHHQAETQALAAAFASQLTIPDCSGPQAWSFQSTWRPATDEQGQKYFAYVPGNQSGCLSVMGCNYQNYNRAFRRYTSLISFLFVNLQRLRHLAPTLKTAVSTIPTCSLSFGTSSPHFDSFHVHCSFVSQRKLPGKRSVSRSDRCASTVFFSFRFCRDFS